MRLLSRGSSLSLIAVLALAAATPAVNHRREAAPKLRTLIVGGGPNLSHNQVAIESNVRYMGRMLPAETPTRVLFADGDMNSKTVLFTDEKSAAQYRAPNLFRLDGPAQLTNVQTEIDQLAKDQSATPKTPVFLYFTGHGSGNAQSNYTNNQFDLWSGQRLTVKDLSTSLKAFPKGTPITLLMVECFSGAFGNLLFQDAEPTGELNDQQICGFFASVPQRVAAGCTPELNEANYRDFTGYFLAALTGTDRLGKPVTGADYNKDGKVGMNEAFAYSLINDDSIDTPVCTSDFFLRRFVTIADDQMFVAPYSDVQKWAAPAQLAALDALSAHLQLTGEDRLQVAFNEFSKMNMNSDRDRDVHLLRYVRLGKSVVLAHALNGMSDRKLKKRYADLLKMEAGNPLKP